MKKVIDKKERVEMRKRIYSVLTNFNDYDIFKKCHIYCPLELKKYISINIVDYLNENKKYYEWGLRDTEFIFDNRKWILFHVTKKYYEHDLNDIGETMKFIFTDEEDIS